MVELTGFANVLDPISLKQITEYISVTNKEYI